MSTIYLDPVAMDAAAGAIGESAGQVQASVSTLESTCSAAVPVALGGWLAEELHDIAVQAQLVALLYTVAALDTALRAQQIQADQSLVAAQPELATTSVDLGAALAMGSVVGGNSFSVGTIGGFESTMTIGGTGAAFVNDFPGLGNSFVGGNAPLEISDLPDAPTMTSIGGRTSGPYRPGDYLDAWGQVQHINMPVTERLLANPATNALAQASLRALADHQIGLGVSPQALTYVAPNTFEDRSGRQGGIGETYRDPRTGDYGIL